MWVIWPREGSHIDIVWQFRKVCLAASDLNWRMVYEPTDRDADV